MFNLFNAMSNGAVTLLTYGISALAAAICGIIVALASSYRAKLTKSFVSCLIILPIAVQTVIIMVNGSIGTGIAVAGAFSLVRFRSVPGKAKDIVSIFVAMASGLACAAGYVTVGIIFALVSSIFMVAVAGFRLSSEKEAELCVTVPETLNYSGSFDDIFEKYTRAHKLIKVKTSNMGSLYKLTYRIELKNSEQTKEFIDELRCRNGNLEIALYDKEDGIDEL